MFGRFLVLRKRYLNDGIGVALWLLGIFPDETKDTIFAWRGAHDLDAMWDWPCKLTLCGRGDNLTYKPLKSGHMAILTSCPHKMDMRWECPRKVDMRQEWPCEVILCGRGDNSTFVSKSDIMCPSWECKCIMWLSSHMDMRYMWGEFCTLNRCYFSDVQAANDEDLKKFFLKYSKYTLHSCEMALPQSHLVWVWGGYEVRIPMQGDIHIPKVTPTHARWMQGENIHARWEMVMRGEDTPGEVYEPPSEILHSLIFCFFGFKFGQILL